MHHHPQLLPLLEVTAFPVCFLLPIYPPLWQKEIQNNSCLPSQMPREASSKKDFPSLTRRRMQRGGWKPAASCTSQFSARNSRRLLLVRALSACWGVLSKGLVRSPPARAPNCGEGVGLGGGCLSFS